MARGHRRPVPGRDRPQALDARQQRPHQPTTRRAQLQGFARREGQGATTFDYVGDALKSPELAKFQKKDPKTQQPIPIRDSTLHLYAIIVLATRSEAGKTWAGNYTKPQIMSAKKGGKQAGLHDEIMRCFTKLGTDEKIAELFVDPSYRTRNVQLLVVTRTGTGIQDTKWAVALAEGDQKSVDAPFLGDKFDGRSVKIQANIYDDVATALTSECDLIPYVAGTFMPSNEELGTFCANLNIGVKKTAEQIEQEMKAAAEAQKAGGAAATTSGGKKTAAG